MGQVTASTGVMSSNIHQLRNAFWICWDLVRYLVLIIFSLQKHGVVISPEVSTNGETGQNEDDDVSTTSTPPLPQELAHGGRQSMLGKKNKTCNQMSLLCQKNNSNYQTLTQDQDYQGLSRHFHFNPSLNSLESNRYRSLDKCLNKRMPA